MGFRFRKSVKIAPGVRLNFGKKSTSVSLGGKGARFTINNKGKRTASFGIPGTGLYYTESVGGTKKRKDNINMANMNTETKDTKHKKPFYKKWWFWIAIVCIIALCSSCTAREDTTKGTLPESEPGIFASVDQKADPVPEVEVATFQDEVVAENTTTEQEHVEENQSTGTDYVGNKNSKKFHYAWCNSVDKMKESNKYYYTGTSEEMVAKGYEPCGNCNP